MNQPVFVESRPQWKHAEAGLHHEPSLLPLCHRQAWAEHHPGSRHSLLTLRGQHGDVVPCAAVQFDRSRLLPGHHHLRVLRFGHGLPQAAWEPAVSALADLARNDIRALRLNIGVFSRENRGEIAIALAWHGFKRSLTPQSYRHTLTVDLQPDADKILLGLHKTARKNLRVVEKSTLFLRTLTEDVYATRIASLQAAALNRTGGTARAIDWHAILRLSRLNPLLSRIVGVFASETDVRPEALLGFGWCCMHGDHGEYRAAGTAREAGMNLPLSYPILWNLILWAKQEGATWFDLGGVSVGDDPLDPLSGISDFKRYFSRILEEVGDEWTLEPHPARTHMAAFVGRCLHRSAGMFNRIQGEAGQRCRTIS